MRCPPGGRGEQGRAGRGAYPAVRLDTAHVDSGHKPHGRGHLGVVVAAGDADSVDAAVVHGLEGTGVGRGHTARHTYPARSHNGAYPVGEGDVLGILQTIADVAVAEALEAVVKLLEKDKISGH